MRGLMFILLFTLVTSFLHSQHVKPDPNVGHRKYTKQGIMDGNMVRTMFFNHGEVAHWPDQPSGEWPKGSGHSYVDGVAMIVQVETRDRSGKIFHPMETMYREFIDIGPDVTPWGWAPLPGYANPTQPKPAISNDPSTWPAFWPDRPPDWAGFWNGYFGKGVKNADLETYFVFDDDPDEEWNFYPDPDDTTRRGIGMEVAMRGFQWSHVLAQDVIFWHYEILNEGKTSYQKCLFAQYIDWGVGGTDDSGDDSGLYDTELDIAWAFDSDGLGTPGRWGPVGVAGYAFLESPGIQNDGKDNDDDGIIDERRNDPDAGMLIKGRENIIAYIQANYDLGKFLRFYNYSSVDDIPAVRQGYWWTADENMNWRGFTDLNENGRWDNGEPLNDDVGSDGIGPLDEGYTGPDADGSEGNGRPDQGEPNFGILDKDESDQIGLTGFSIFPVHTYELWDDEQNWSVFTAPLPARDQLLQSVNLGMFFSSGIFPMPAGHVERFSMALLFGQDRNDLIKRKKTVQQIYNANYRFAKPPEKPRLVAIPGDKKVTLYWDSRAELSWDPFLQEYDFEGYKIYKSTDPSFLEAFVITDAHGNKLFKKPIAQFDLVNGIKGYHPIDIYGLKYYLGDDSGLRHSFVDYDVQNGQTYYYAVVSYDRGYVTRDALGNIDGIAPSECTAIIKADVTGTVKPDINTAIVTPNPPSAGYIEAGLDGNIAHIGPGTGKIQINLLQPDSVKDGHIYRVIFADTSKFYNSPVPKYSIYDMSDGRKIVDSVELSIYGQESPVFDGLIIYLYNDSSVSLDNNRTGWVKGNSNYIVRVDLDPTFVARNIRYPADFEVRFSDKVVDTSLALIFGQQRIPVKFTVWNLTENKKADFIFFDVDKDSILSPGDRLIIVLGGDSATQPPSSRSWKATWRVQFFEDTLKPVQIPPSPGDVFLIATKKPFRNGEYFEFKVRGQKIDIEKAKHDLDKIAVVPNPYVATASWEPANRYRAGRGERKIWFINIPKNCTIRIYTIRGYLVDTIVYNGTDNYGAVSWDLVSKDGMDIAYGIYIYHVEAPGIGEKIGRFAVIK